MDLRNIFKVGDIVQFDAVIGPDDARCKWRYVTKIVIFFSTYFQPIYDRYRYTTMWRFDAISLRSSFFYYT